MIVLLEVHRLPVHFWIWNWTDRHRHDRLLLGGQPSWESRRP